MPSGRILVGTAGWSLPTRNKPDFPDTGTHLQRYAARFPAVEINSSFHRPHRRATYERWAANVPEGFRFSAKLPRTITHDLRLFECEHLLRIFLDEVAGLGEKLGVLLIQLPPSLAFEADIAAAFFASIRSLTTAALACEPRHASWFAAPAEELLLDMRVARVAADPASVPAAGSLGGWSGLGYFRLHGSPVVYRSGYDEERLRAYAERIATAAECGDLWCIFDNTARMAATGDALLLQRLIGVGQSVVVPSQPRS